MALDFSNFTKRKTQRLKLRAGTTPYTDFYIVGLLKGNIGKKYLKNASKKTTDGKQ